MDLASRYDVLVLELISCSPGLFNYADKQLLKSRDPDAIERLIERKLRRLWWNIVGAIAFMMLIAAQFVLLAVTTGEWQNVPGVVIWIGVLPIWALRLTRERAAMRDCVGRLVNHLKSARAGNRRAG